MTSDTYLAEMRQHIPPALEKLNADIRSYDDDSGVLEIRFSIDESFCHSGDVIQGGYIAVMLDGTMAHAAVARLQEHVIVATLEVKITYLEISRPGMLTARGRVVKLGKSIGFFDAELTDAEGKLLATASSTARVIRKKSPA